METITSWNVNYRINETEHLTKISIKWDGCSHVWFNEVDYKNSTDDNNVEIDAYYHLCGFRNFLLFYKGLSFAYKIADELMDIDSNDDRYNEILSGCTIIYIEEDNYDDSVYEVVF